MRVPARTRSHSLASLAMNKWLRVQTTPCILCYIRYVPRNHTESVIPRELARVSRLLSLVAGMSPFSLSFPLCLWEFVVASMLNSEEASRRLIIIAQIVVTVDRDHKDVLRFNERESLGTRCACPYCFMSTCMQVGTRVRGDVYSSLCVG